MRTSVRKLGNSSGVVIPKSVLAEAGLTVGDAMDLSLDEGRIVLAPIRQRPRAGWAEASKKIAAAGDDAVIWPEFSSAEDEALDW